VKDYGPPPAPKADGRDTFIYALHDPEDVSDRVYVGMTVAPRSRLADHMSASSLKKKTLKNGWIKSMLARGSAPAMVILECVHGDDYQEAEIFWIASLRAIGVQLVNGTDGGHGGRGRILSKESKVKISTSHKGVKLSPEHRASISAIKNDNPVTSLRKDSTQPFRGVRWKAGGWDARIKGSYLGRFKTAEDAALAFDAAARTKWGARAVLNFPATAERHVRKLPDSKWQAPPPAPVDRARTNLLRRASRSAKKAVGICIHCAERVVPSRTLCKRHLIPFKKQLKLF
jgi:hypothetical protein